jgi:hypothetical protein
MYGSGRRHVLGSWLIATVSTRMTVLSTGSRQQANAKSGPCRSKIRASRIYQPVPDKPSSWPAFDRLKDASSPAPIRAPFRSADRRGSESVWTYEPSSRGAKQRRLAGMLQIVPEHPETSQRDALLRSAPRDEGSQVSKQLPGAGHSSSEPRRHPGQARSGTAAGSIGGLSALRWIPGRLSGAQDDGAVPRTNSVLRFRGRTGSAYPSAPSPERDSRSPKALKASQTTPAKAAAAGGRLRSGSLQQASTFCDRRC